VDASRPWPTPVVELSVEDALATTWSERVADSPAPITAGEEYAAEDRQAFVTPGMSGTHSGGILWLAIAERASERFGRFLCLLGGETSWRQDRAPRLIMNYALGSVDLAGTLACAVIVLFLW
jgi:hypothetical protein